MRFSTALILAILASSATSVAAQETPSSPDYSSETLTFIFRDQYVDPNSAPPLPRFAIYEFKYKSPVNPYLSFALRTFLGVASLPGTTMEQGDLTPVIDPFRMTNMSFPFTPSTFRDKAFDRKLRRQLNAALKKEK